MNISRDVSGIAAVEGADNASINLPSTQACAACKFQRRKCSADCPLAPYFPANRLQDFRNVRRLFGVKNVLKTLSGLEPSKRSKAVQCIIFEANCRASDLAGGCYKIIAKLQREITLLEAQHRVVLRQLRLYRQTAARAIRSEFDFDCKPWLSGISLDCCNWENFEDSIRKESCSSNGRLMTMENGVSFSKRVSH